MTKPRITREVQLKIFLDNDDDPHKYWHWNIHTHKDFLKVKSAIETALEKLGERYD